MRDWVKPEAVSEFGRLEGPGLRGVEVDSGVEVVVGTCCTGGAAEGGKSAGAVVVSVTCCEPP